MKHAIFRCPAWLFACWSGLGCSAPAAPLASPPVFQVQVPIEPEHLATPEPAGKFACEADQAKLSRRVRFSVRSTTRGAHSDTKETRASYTIRLSQHGHDGRASASVTLESLTTGVGETQSAWSTAVDRQWIQLGVPFTVTRQHETWCFMGSEPCGDPERAEISAAIGETVQLLDLTQLKPQLDGKPSDGDIRLTLPEPLLKRLGLGVVQASESFASARQMKRGFPALFVTRSETAPAEGNARTVSASIEIDRHCRIRSLKAELLSLRAQEGYAPEVTHRFTWRFDPIP